MEISYSIHNVPNMQSENKEETHQARINSSGTVRIEELCKLISSRSTVSSADVKATLDSLNYCFEFLLSQGYRIELDDLGIFSLGLKCKKNTATDGRSMLTIKVNGIHFRPSMKLKEQLKTFKLKHKAKREKQQYTQETRMKRIMNYIKEHDSISRTACLSLNNVSRHVATMDLQRLLNTNSIKALGDTCNRLYIKKEEPEENQ